MSRSSYFPISHIILLTRHYETSAMRGRKHLCYNIFILHTTHCHNIVGIKVWVEPFGKVEGGTMREGQLERRVKRERKVNNLDNKSTLKIFSSKTDYTISSLRDQLDKISGVRKVRMLHQKNY